MGGAAVFRERQSTGSAFLLEERSISFDRLLVPLQYDSQTLGNTTALRTAAQSWLTRENEYSVAGALITDGRLNPVIEPLRAVTLEYGVDTRYSSLNQRFSYAKPAVSEFLQSGRMQQPWFGGAIDLEEAIEQIAPESLEAGHGTAVASLLAADLPDLKISLMPASNSSYIGEPAVVAIRLIDEITKQAPMVVNISQDFSEKCRRLRTCVWGRV